MITWNDAGREALDRHLGTLRATVVAGGGDMDAIAENLRRHIETEVAVTGLAVVDREQVERILSLLPNPPLGPASAQADGRGTGKRAVRKSLVWGGAIFNGLLGVVLPLLTLGIEWATGMCTEFFDPIPTVWHVAAIVLVAVANAFALRVALASAPSGALIRRAILLNAGALGIAAFYALCFSPLTPFAVMAVLFFGLGLLPLSPLLSLIVGVLLRRSLFRRSRASGLTTRRAWPWAAATFALMLLLEVPGALQSWATHAAVHADAAGQARALGWLRLAGSEDALLRGCYPEQQSARIGVHAYLFGETTQEERRQVYYRVTGQAYNRVPAPPRRSSFMGGDRGGDRSDWVWDGSLGDDRVGQRLKALYLKASRIDGKLESAAAVGYLEWTLEFRNDHAFQQREARALVQLPPGAVVSRLTLWINGEEREAAFGTRGQVRQAYQAIVQQRRDPVLVTTKGPDRVLVQCFPIEPKGGEMKVRIGLTVPLAIDQPGAARFALPRLIEQNFSADPGLSHAVWIEADRPLTSGLSAYRSEVTAAARQGVRGMLDAVQFASPAAGLTVARDPHASEAWTADPTDATRRIAQTIARQGPSSTALAVVIDGSREMAASARALADVLETMPPGFTLQVWLAGDRVLACPVQAAREVAAWLRAQAFVGGQDAASALGAGLDALGDREGTLLWIHGEQPVKWQGTAAVAQALAARSGRVRLLTFPAVSGGNVLLEELTDGADVAVAGRVGEVGEDLGRALRRLREGGWVAVRRRTPVAQSTPSGREASVQLWRLWAAEEVGRLLSGTHPRRAVASELALAARIVTPVSGAVVLETRQQYDAAGLDPGDASEVHTVPDGGATLILIGATWVVLIVMSRRKLAQGRRLTAG